MSNLPDPLQQKLIRATGFLNQNQNLGNFTLISNTCFQSGIKEFEEIIQMQSSMIEELQKQGKKTEEAPKQNE